MIRYLIDSSGLWGLSREVNLRAAWSDAVAAGTVGSCHPQRAEFRRSARGLDEYEVMTDMFETLYPDVPVPKTAWSWVESAQYRLVRAGVHKAFFTVDLLICATAALNGLTVLHDDKDFRTAARFVTDLAERPVRRMP